MIEIANSATISPLADIEDSSRDSLISIGEHTLIDSFVKFKAAGGSGNIVIGEHVAINSGCVLYIGNGIRIGDHVSIAANCVFAPVNHEYKSRDLLIQKQGFKPSKNGIIVEDDVWIGANCTLLDGAILRRGCVVGAGSVIRGELQEYSINAGQPLKTVGYRE